MRTKIKICGLKCLEDITYINEARPDYCGFIIAYPKSSRSISVSRLKELTRDLDPKILPVGVFVNADLSLVEDLLKEQIIGAAQLHGQEDEAYIQRIQQNTGKPVIKVFSVKTEQDVKEAVQSSADYILFDQGSGGSGKTFDWSLIKEIDRPFFLAGGLQAENIKKAIHTLEPFAIDLSSGVETNGKKDRKKILEAVRITRLLYR